MYYNSLSFYFFPDGEPLKLPESLESLPKSDHFPSQRHRWNTNEVSQFLIYFSKSQTLIVYLQMYTYGTGTN